MAFVVGGVQRDTVSLGGQEFTLSTPLASGTVLWVGSSGTATIEMPGIVQSDWRNVPNGIQIELEKRILSKSQPDLWANTFIDTNKLVYVPAAPFKVSKSLLQSQTAITFQENTPSGTSTLFTYESNGTRNGKITQHGTITVTPSRHGLSIVATNLKTAEVDRPYVTDEWTLTIGKISAY